MDDKLRIRNETSLGKFTAVSKGTNQVTTCDQDLVLPFLQIR